MSKSEALGDIAFQAFTKYPAKFGIKSGIVKLFIESIYEVMWELHDAAKATNAKDIKIRLNVLSGEHEETAFVDVRLGSTCVTNQ